MYFNLLTWAGIAFNGFEELGIYLEQNGSDSVVIIPTMDNGFKNPVDEYVIENEILIIF